MKNFLTVVVVLGLAVCGTARQLVWAQAPAWQTALLAGNPATGSSSSVVNATVAGTGGSVLVVGTFQGTISLSGISLASAGGNDVFVAKWNPVANAFAWAVRAGGSGNDQGEAVAVSGTNVYVGGSFRNTATFGQINLQSIGTVNGFVAKISDVGSGSDFSWSQRVGGAGAEYVYALAASGTSVYATGGFDMTASFGAISLASAGGGDIFVAKLTDMGSFSSFTWARQAGGASLDQPAALLVSGTSVYVAGGFASPSAIFGSTTLTSTGNGNGFVAKLTDAGSAGNYVWARQAAGTSFNNVNALALNGSVLYAGGVFQGTVGLGSTVLTSVGDFDGFVARLVDTGPVGDFAWAQRLGGPGADVVRAIVASGSDVYAAGVFTGTSSFGPLSLTSANFTDGFVTKLADFGTAGAFAWAQRAGGAGYDQVNALAITSTGTLCGGGFCLPPAAFGATTLVSPFTNSLGFVAALAGNVLATAGPARLAGAALFPNPAHGRATVRLPAGIAPAVFTIVDAVGRVVRTQAATAGDAALDLDGLVPGLYAVRVTAGAVGATQWLVVE